MLAVPVAIETSRTDASLLQQWRTIYVNGHIKGPAIAMTVGAALAALAALKHRIGEDPTTSAIAAVATAGIVPYTWVVMGGVNRSLHSVAAGTGSDTVDIKNSVIKWSRLNAARGIMPLIGGLISLWGVISNHS